MTVKVCRADGDSYPVIVKQDVSVSGFKKAIRHHVDLQQSRKGSLLRISWRHVWKRYWLVYCGVKLKDDNKLLRDYDIRNRDEVHFIPRLREWCLCVRLLLQEMRSKCAVNVSWVAISFFNANFVSIAGRINAWNSPPYTLIQFVITTLIASKQTDFIVNSTVSQWIW